MSQGDVVAPASRSARWPATGRYGYRPAPPGGLALVQDLLNTRASGRAGPDLLAERDSAQSWARTALRLWSVVRGTEPPLVDLSGDDVLRLREVRDRIDGAVRGNASVISAGESAVVVTLSVRAPGELALMPSGHGWPWLRSAVWGELALSHETGTWPRLRQCSDPWCCGTFYDSTWNLGVTCCSQPGDAEHVHRQRK
jgi:hypothetical protein